MHGMARRITAIATIAPGALLGPVAQAESDSLEHRVEQLEHRLSESEAGPIDAVAWSGAVEVEAFAADDFAGNETSDIELATLELGAEARLNEYVAAHTVLLFEEGPGEDLDVDEAAITISHPESPWGGTLGRVYVPFGAFETALVSDSLPLELGETRETAAVLRYGGGAIHGAAYAFRGDTSDGGDEHIESFGLQFGLRGDTGGVRYGIGTGYSSSLGDSDALALARVEDRVGAVDL